MGTTEAQAFSRQYTIFSDLRIKAGGAVERTQKGYMVSAKPPGSCNLYLKREHRMSPHSPLDY